ncbi:hypothetical protein ACFX2G_044271 [Malus domestica]
MKDNACDVAIKNWLLGTIDNMGERYESVTDCVIGLLRKGKNASFVKWNLSELYAKMEIMKIHELEEVVQVGGGSPKTPETEKKIIQLRSHGGGINVEPHKVSDEEFLPMFDILPSEFLENNLGKSSNSKADLNDLERKLQEMSLLVEDYCS